MTAFGARCPHCDTLFKVYPDLLRLHNGFANCGACAHTFDVQAGLIFLPKHETSYLAQNNQIADGLPVLNAVAHVTSNLHPPPPASSDASPASVSSTTASNSANLSIKLPEPAPAQAVVPSSKSAASATATKTLAGTVTAHTTTNANNLENQTSSIPAKPIRTSPEPAQVEQPAQQSVASVTAQQSTVQSTVELNSQNNSNAQAPVRVVPKKITETLEKNTKIPTLNFINQPDIVPTEQLKAPKKKNDWFATLILTLIQWLIVLGVICALGLLVLLVAEPEQKQALARFIIHYLPESKPYLEQFDSILKAWQAQIKG